MGEVGDFVLASRNRCASWPVMAGLGVVGDNPGLKGVGSLREVGEESWRDSQGGGNQEILRRFPLDVRAKSAKN